jgi:hypothetical protein
MYSCNACRTTDCRGLCGTADNLYIGFIAFFVLFLLIFTYFKIFKIRNRFKINNQFSLIFWLFIIIYTISFSRSLFPNVLKIVIDHPDKITVEHLENNYLKDKKAIYYWPPGPFEGGNSTPHRVKRADLKSFQVLNNTFAKDHDTIFAAGQVIKGMDYESFDYLDYYFSKDKNSVFYGIEKIIGADPNSFQGIDYFYSKDKDNVYFTNQKLTEYDAETFALIDNGTFNNNNYYKDKNGVYFHHHTIPWTYKGGPIDYKFNVYEFNKLENIDLDSFEVFDNREQYFKDKNGLYYRNLNYGKYKDYKKLDFVDKDSFEIIDIQGYDGKDKNNFYYQGEIEEKPLEEIDTSTFSQIPPIGDKDYYYYKYFKDKNNVYFTNGSGLKLIPNADSETFEIIKQEKNDSTFAKDANQVYKYGEPIPNADPNTIAILNNFYAKDKNRVFYRNSMISDADPNTIQVLSTSCAKDKNNVYQQEKKINAHAPSFEYLGSGYAKDKNHIYTNKNKILKKADLKTFRVLDKEGKRLLKIYKKIDQNKEFSIRAYDKNHLYSASIIKEDITPELYQFLEENLD